MTFKVDEVRPIDSTVPAVQTSMSNVAEVAMWLEATSVTLEFYPVGEPPIGVSVTLEDGEEIDYKFGDWLVVDARGKVVVYNDDDFKKAFKIRIGL